MSRAAGVRVVGLVVLCVAVLITCLVWIRPSGESATQRPWRTVGFEGIRVDIPDNWKPIGANACEFVFAERAPDSNVCARTPGVRFDGIATTDFSHLPGIYREAGDWWGYVIVGGKVAVFASASNRSLVQRVLNSARASSNSEHSGSATNLFN